MNSSSPVPQPQDPKNPNSLPEASVFESERNRIVARRTALGLNHPAGEKSWALALSGGGIRSATFALGVLQGMAKWTHPRGEPLLKYFDYASTVSGGGYIGGFFCSLFVPERLDSATKDPAKAAKEAYLAMAFEPPGRGPLESVVGMPRALQFGARALAWLRNNGRYLAPTGSGDLFYASALAIRNWFSLQFVIGTMLLLAFALVTAARATASWRGWTSGFEQELLGAALSGSGLISSIWWSPLWLLPVVVWMLWTLPAGLAYWLSHPDKGETAASEPQVFSGATVWHIVLIVVLTAVAVVAFGHPDQRPAALVLALGVVSMIMSCLFHFFIRGASINMQRVRLTHAFSRSLQCFLTLVAMALADTLGQTLYLWLAEGFSSSGQMLAPGGLLAALIWAIRKLARMFDTQTAKESWISKLPVDWIAGAAGLLLLLSITLFWAVLAQWVRWNSLAPSLERIDHVDGAWAAVGLFAITLFIALVIGRFPGFINQSSLQWFYGSRLTRAFLGGSNHERFADHSRWQSVADAHPKDEMACDLYYKSHAPIHLINITVNETTDPGEQLVQRDRKGRPMAVGPHGFAIDGLNYKFKEGAREHQMPMRVGQWIGTSGAAFTTGLGRATSLGTSLALGLSNVRLGSWWESGIFDERQSIGVVERCMLGMFPSQTYLGYEFMAQFHGKRRRWQYLSDGGHFENTGVYELLRPGRGVQLIVLCDDGRDPLYEFEDLANLIRLARIDHRIEIELDEKITQSGELGGVFGTPEQFRDSASGSNKCAMLLTATAVSPMGGREPLAVILLLKPALIACCPIDVVQYAKANPEFPQQPTSDQFFDEAQWESYRKLGRCAAGQVFGECGEALWGYLDQNHGVGI